MKTKILVCGGTGFIGRNCLESLATNSKCEIYGTYFLSDPPNISGVEMIKANLTDKDAVKEAIKGMDIVIQAAATTSGAKDIIEMPYYHVTDNAVMNSIIFRTAFECNVSHVIFFSCTVMYQSSGIPVKEDDFDANKEIYRKHFGVGWTKVYLEKMCDFYSRIGKTKYTVIRHSNIYGPYDKFDLEKSHVFGATISKIMAVKNGGKIVVWGTGEEERDLLYISDLVEFVKSAIEYQDSKFGIFNVGYGKSISIKKLVDKIIYHSGKDIRVEYDLSKPTINTKICLDITKAKEVFGWIPVVPIDEGIKKAIDWLDNIETGRL